LVVACSGAGGSGSAAPTAYPVQLDTATGKLTIAHQPSRIVSLSATATEDLYSVGAGKQVVAVDSYSTYPAEAPRTDLSGFTPNLEAIARYRPDLVLVAGDTNNLVAQLATLQIPTLVEPAAADLNAVYAEITQIAQATGHAAAAKQVVASVREQVQTIVRSVPPPSRPLTVYHELDQTYFSATSHTFIGQVYTLLHLRDIADQAAASSDYPQLSAEYIIASNPDLIVLADTVCCSQDLATVRARPGWSGIKAVRTGAILPVNDSIASEWGPRIVLFLQAIAKAVKALEGTPK
jgi:iron complex transport system substrate-binding protein